MCLAGAINGTQTGGTHEVGLQCCLVCKDSGKGLETKYLEQDHKLSAVLPVPESNLKTADDSDV